MYQSFKEDMPIWILHTLTQKIQEEGVLSNKLYKASALGPKPDKSRANTKQKQKKLQANILDEHGCNIPYKILANGAQQDNRMTDN
jgi:hypothetical protein